MLYNKKQLNLLLELFLSQFKLKDQSSFFGYLWSFLHPLLMLGVMFLIFHSRIGQGIDHYGLFLLIGIVQYAHFANSTTVSMRILSSLRSLTCDTIFPKELLVLASVFATSIEFVISMAICALIALLSGMNLGWGTLLLPALIVVQIMLVASVTLFLACVFVFIKDVDHIYQLFLRLLFFMTPIFYAPALLNAGNAKLLAIANPLTHLLSFSRSILMGGSIHWMRFAAFFAVNILFLLLSFQFFKRYEPTFAEHL